MEYLQELASHSRRLYKCMFMLCEVRLYCGVSKTLSFDRCYNFILD